MFFFQRDFPPKERQKYRELYKELMLRRGNGEPNLRIWNGRIVYSKNHWEGPIIIRKENI
jgi:hypothetical protein